MTKPKTKTDVFTKPQADWIEVSPEFFRGRAEEIAPQLPGMYLSHETAEGFRALQISEVEIYSGESDSACHASRGRTPRSSVLYERSGTLYVYLCYGMHHLLNIVTFEEGFPEAVLIRACFGAEGPGKLTKALGITTAYHGLHLENVPELRLWTDGRTYPVTALPRIGIDYAREEDRIRPWRFITTRRREI